MDTPPLPLPVDDETDLVAYAGLLARFAHRFADRGGVLDARGLAEDDFARLEASALGLLAAASATGDQRTLQAFARAVIAGRSAVAPESGEPSTHAAPTRREHPDEETFVPTSDQGAAAAIASPPAVDLADLMATLHSEASRSR